MSMGEGADMVERRGRDWGGGAHTFLGFQVVVVVVECWSPHFLGLSGQHSLFVDAVVVVVVVVVVAVVV